MIINDVQFNSELSDILSELKKQLSLNNITLLGKTKESTNDIMVSCPYHNNGQEKRPSAGISKKDGTFHCFACNEVHSLPEVISYCFGYKDDVIGTFGWNWLLKNFVSIGVEERKDIELDILRGQIYKQDHQFVSDEELDKYRYTHPYMYKRKLTDEIIELFDIGYDAKTDCITFPVRDIDGNCLFVARRATTYKYFNYPRGVEKPLYGLYELYHLDSFPREVVVCESMLDALAVWVYGGYAVALNGLGNELQFKQLRSLPCRELVLATDNDSAGQRARQRIRANVKNKIISEYIIPEGKKDMNDLTEQEYKKIQKIF